MRQERELVSGELAGVEPGSSVHADSPGPASGAVADNRLFVLVLQHPQERSEPRATASAMVETLRRSRLVVGLSWPNLTRALGGAADPRRWGVLYLGSTRPLSPPPQPPQPHNPPRPSERQPGRATPGEIIVLSGDGASPPAAGRMLRGLDGIVLLDGTWSQAKTLWWRNPWLLKLRRLVLNPRDPARFGQLRREPRPEALSTLEAASLVLRHSEPGPEAADALLAALDRLIAACGGQPAAVSANADDSNPSRGRSGGGLSVRRRRYPGRSAAE
jgi:DTW domain-containing protein YfiP